MACHNGALLTDERFSTLLSEAMDRRSAVKLEEYLETCTVCDGQNEVAATLALLEKLDSARQQFENALRLSPDYRAAAINLARGSEKDTKLL